ncbi:cytochrome P450 76A2-like [Papaver somniferum]|uniref:cytochrome P450 76A2-like n=1 Tax=Papaver somniferum TaxID=3469 RepID=UPI000E7014C3|nr:cytochrome P450 76A2-like [Papaver somniferum]
MGAVNALVIASADAATELFKNHDQAFLNRHPIQALQPLKGDFQATPWSAYGPIWRMNRRLYATIFSRTTMKNTLGKRRQFVDQIIRWISVEEKQGRSVEIKHLTLVAFANLLGNLFFSKDVMDLKSSTGTGLYQLLGEIVALSTTPNVADFFPWLRNLDPQNVAKRTKKAVYACANILDGFAKERRSTDVLHNNKEEKDYWDLLMDFEGNGKDEPRKMSDRHINSFITEIFVGGSDSLINSVEWVMTEVVRYPEVMRKAKDELAQVVGYNRKIEESDIESLPYLGAVIKETLRLHPAAPLLIPRTTVEEMEFIGYTIPQDTAVLVNVWGIARDAALWDDPFSFNPERFLGNTTDYRGQHFQYLPFGCGRRMCPGLPMAHQILHIVVGSLLQSFDWTLEDGVTPESIDMNGKFQASLQKSIPLRIIPRASPLAV